MRLLILFLLLTSQFLVSMNRDGLRRRHFCKAHDDSYINKDIFPKTRDMRECLKQHAHVIQGLGTCFLVAGSFCIGLHAAQLEDIRNKETLREICYSPEIKEIILSEVKYATFMTVAGLLCCIKGSKDLCC